MATPKVMKPPKKRTRPEAGTLQAIKKLVQQADDLRARYHQETKRRS